MAGPSPPIFPGHMPIDGDEWTHGAHAPEPLGPYIERADQSIADALKEQAEAARQVAAAISSPNWPDKVLGIAAILTIALTIFLTVEGFRRMWKNRGRRHQQMVVEDLEMQERGLNATIKVTEIIIADQMDFYLDITADMINSKFQMAEDEDIRCHVGRIDGTLVGTNGGLARENIVRRFTDPVDKLRIGLLNFLDPG
ncbi:hypothetical protein B0T14DRAFT_568209 [Immersiella caudata]|uniref:Uncharacterized protein n=1 Tax=Immersiella caudata TaxID=314043 RepID=A0AA40BWW6_9PEZI|nr:hypothetical protein B0T14DRAFT_568209 [Immersiella caudata]